MLQALVSGGTTAVDMSEVVTTGLTSVANNMTSVIASIVPVALGLVGSVMVVTFGIRLFRRLTGNK